MDWLKFAYRDLSDNEYVGCLYEQTPNGKKSSVMLNDEKLYDFDINRPGVFYTLNSFSSKTSRKTANVFKYRAFYLDVDSYHKGIKLEDALAGVKKEMGTTIPYPSAIVRSGQGFYLVWFIEPIGPEYSIIWSNIQTFLHNRLKKYGSDPISLDASRVLRVPGSINAKPGVNKIVAVDEFNPDAVYTIDGFANWFGKTPEDFKEFCEKVQARPTNTQKKNNPNNKGKIKTYYPNKQLASLRAQDIATFLSNKKEDVVGRREVGLFLYRHFLLQAGYSQKDALNMTLDLNAILYYPLSVSEANAATKTPKNTFYKYRTSTIINKLGISIEEQKNLVTLNLTKDARMRRWAKTGRTMSRADETTEKQRKIDLLMAQGKTINQICDIMSFSRTTFYKLTKGRKPTSSSNKVVSINPRIWSIIAEILKYKQSNDKHVNSVNLLSHIKKNKYKELGNKVIVLNARSYFHPCKNKNHIYARAGPAP